MNFNTFDDYEEFGKFTVTIEVDPDSECSRADVWLDGNCVNLAYVEGGCNTGEPEWDDILDAVYESGLGKEMVEWAYSTDLY